MELLACLSHMRQVLGILRRRSPKARGQAKGWGEMGVSGLWVLQQALQGG